MLVEYRSGLPTLDKQLGFWHFLIQTSHNFASKNNFRHFEFSIIFDWNWPKLSFWNCQKWVFKVLTYWSNTISSKKRNLKIVFRTLNGLECVHLLVIELENTVFGFERMDIEHFNKLSSNNLEHHQRILKIVLPEMRKVRN